MKLIPRTRHKEPKNPTLATIKGRKYKYPSNKKDKLKLYIKAKKYVTKLLKGEIKKRDYRLEYFYYHARPIEKKRRLTRTVHRNKLMKKGIVKKYDGTEIDHLRPDTLSFNHIVVRKSRCTHNRAWGNKCKHCQNNVY